MLFATLLQLLRRRPRTAGQATRKRSLSFKPRLEILEDRVTPSTYNAASVSDLVGDINAANLKGGTNTITLAAQTTFTLTAVDNTTDNANGLPVIAASNSLTIVGNQDTIERSAAAGTPAFRLFDVAAGGSLTLENLTLRNGLETDASLVGGEGGAIYNQGTVNLSGVTVANNAAPNSDSGAIYNTGALSISGGSLTGNSAAAGGAILNNNFGSLIIDAASLTSNSAVFGGAISNYMGSLTVRDFSTLSGNSAGAEGGAIENSYGIARLDQSTLSGNSTGGAGGAIDNLFGTMTVEQCTLTGNSAVAGGAIYNNVNGTLTVEQTTLSGNFATAEPGSISPFGGCIANDGYLTLEQCTLSGNVAAVNGGCIWNDGFLTIDHCTLSNNVAEQGSGGAVFNSGALTIDHSVVTGNTAGVDGGGIHNDSSSTLFPVLIEFSTVCGNSAPTGADLFNYGSVTLQKSDVCLIDGSGSLTTS
jgi:hypothetical protein